MGGVGGIAGSILGAIFMAEVQNGINILDIPVAYMKPILGLLIIAAVILDQWQKAEERLADHGAKNTSSYIFQIALRGYRSIEKTLGVWLWVFVFAFIFQ